MSWYVQSLVAIWWSKIELQQIENPIEFELWEEIVDEFGPR